MLKILCCVCPEFFEIKSVEQFLAQKGLFQASSKLVIKIYYKSHDQVFALVTKTLSLEM